MSYVVSGLPLSPFSPLFGLSDEALAARGALRITASSEGFYPCRVTLEDAKPSETLLLLDYEHQSAATPYGSSHAISVNEAATETRRLTDQMPDLLATRRLIALRAYDDAGMMVDAEIIPGAEVETIALHAREPIGRLYPRPQSRARLLCGADRSGLNVTQALTSWRALRRAIPG